MDQSSVTGNKYVTKSLAQFGIALRRISPAALVELDVSEHIRAILHTINELAAAGVAGIGKWLRTLGYRGHITSKSRAYWTTMSALRTARRTWTQQHRHPYPSHDVSRVDTNHSVVHQDSPHGSDTTASADAISDEMVWEFDRAGHISMGDRVLVVSEALRRIASRQIGRAEMRWLATHAPDDSGGGGGDR